MRNHIQLADAYYRLSDEERKYGESASITNQRTIVREYCEKHGIILVEEFVDDGFSGGNFERPGFQAMLEHLKTGKANMVITKDLSRLGRDMTESSHYAERYFPEHGIRYLAPGSNFDSEEDNLMAPFQFAMNDVYLRDTSRKVKQTLNTKANGVSPAFRHSIFGGIAYCACCGAAMCSGGSVYNGEREKYWYLVCNNLTSRNSPPEAASPGRALTS